MKNNLAELVSKFRPDRTSKKALKKIGKESGFIVTQFLIESGKPSVSKKMEVVSFKAFVEGNPKQILIKPDNVFSANALQSYSSAVNPQMPEQPS
jgi:hypothetical protein